MPGIKRCHILYSGTLGLTCWLGIGSGTHEKVEHSVSRKKIILTLTISLEISAVDLFYLP
ncbi:hypothetical protein OUZ56_031372 [Daphnia magna]|uniref:Uncharacterized protein n=1 Tax=Daphnia magna TaxID=35525 RepID=A0ABQ9ZUV9_9CRUS|nr:hypothetical protein OUZ56_031372 [Daphnia magna]